MDLELQTNKQALVLYAKLQDTFPKSQYIVSQMALARYNMRDFTEAQLAFESILKHDPYRLDNMDTYSNILYVKEQKTQLSFVAHNALKNEKYRPETCCIIGNYYSLKSQHEKAVLYFKRALQLNHAYLSAWTLMGHEFVEMRNTAAAIEAYRRALDINPRDYRAWYGLGQTYEILQMHFYSLHYFRKATALRPYDARMWCAMGQCYECLDKVEEAIKCYKRAHENGDREGIALNKLGKLFADVMQDNKEAAMHYQNNLALLDAEQVESQQTMDALMFLARYYKDPSLNRLDDAELYCQRLQENYGADKDEVSALMKEIRQVKQRVQAQHFGGIFSSST